MKDITPRKQTARKSLYPTPPSTTKKRGRPPKPLGYLSSQRYSGLGLGKAAARSRFEKEFADFLHTHFAKTCPRNAPRRHHQGHAVTQYRVSKGRRNYTFTGRWFTQCVEGTPDCLRATKYYTDPLSDGDLVKDTELATFLIMREELAADPTTDERKREESRRVTIAHSPVFDRICDSLDIPVDERIKPYVLPRLPAVHQPRPKASTRTLPPLPRATTSAPDPKVATRAPLPFPCPSPILTPDSLSDSEEVELTDSPPKSEVRSGTRTARPQVHATPSRRLSSVNITTFASGSGNRAHSPILVDLSDDDTIMEDSNFPVPRVVMAFIWTKEGNRFQEVLLKADEEHCLRLSDFKLLLGTRHVEEQKAIEIYSVTQQRWVRLPWDRPLGPVSRHVSCLLLRYQGLRQDRLRGFAMLRPHATPISAPVTTKGYDTIWQDTVGYGRILGLCTVDEVAVVLPGVVATKGRDIILRLRQGDYLDRISELHPAYVPLQYPLLFPHGTNGWHQSLYLQETERAVVAQDDDGEEEGGDPRKLTLMRWAAYRIMPRVGEFNTLLYGNRLFSRFVVDMYAAIDQQRLRWVTLNQTQFRTARLNHLEDANMNDPDNLTAHEIGQRVYLPSSYTGGPRNMGQAYQDSMAIARFFGSVDLFLTMTCNPMWPEINDNLLPGQTAYDRPDLVARVFRMKQKVVLDYIYKYGILGVPAAYVYTIEFQKRGLPHMHILIFLRRGFKLITPSLIDACIRAEWPDPVTEPLLFETVKRCMVHGPCGVENPTAVCMVNGKCSKGFPKPFQERTTVGRNGYAVYQRRDDGRAFEVRGRMIDNRWLVPYPPFLLGDLDCHINMECCISLTSIQYVFKYIQKGPDRAALEVEQKDEVKKHLDGRYISPPDAAWRILAFPIHKNVPKVQRLHIHLPGEHNVVFRDEEDIEDVIARGLDKVTTLTAFFAANCDEGELGELARTLTYQEFPQKMVYDQPKKRWKIRQSDFAIGRMYFVKPTAGSIYYLRTLLSIVKGPRSFEDVRRVPGYPDPLPTFHAACVARGLLQDDGEWRLCLLEASQMQVGFRLRHLFATMLLFAEVSRPELLWHEFKVSICSDLERALLRMPTFRHLQDLPSEIVHDYGLHLINDILQEAGFSLGNFPDMPFPQNDWNVHAENPIIGEQLNYDRAAERADFESRYARLNDDQRAAADTILQSIFDEDGRTYFIKGSAGTGKTYVYNTICAGVRSEGWIILCVSSSGISSLLIRGGRTAHSVFRIPIKDLNATSTCNIPKHDVRGELMRRAKAIIWDEVGAQHRHAIEAVNRTLQDVRDDDRPFGGLTTVLGGDFLQTLPVVKKGSREEIVDATMLRSVLWENTSILTLERNMRLEGGGEQTREYAAWIQEVGKGQNIGDDGKVEFPVDMRAQTEMDLIEKIYPGLEGCSQVPPPDFFLHRMILAPRNVDVAALNNDILQMLPGDMREYLSADQVQYEHGVDDPYREAVPVEMLRSISGSGIPPGELRLKVGCPVILLRNLDPALGLCNGTRLVVVRMTDRVVEGRILGGAHDRELVFIPRISLTPSDSIDSISFTFKRRQFPLQLAFALTINKAQGQSVKHVGIDLRIPVFGHGQLYVALSRVTSPENIAILLDEEALDNRTENVVYQEVIF
ncbi:hypothetical protein NMY22_g12605 [Coprinellus aureogranulatus]|nr:hypothetical protein NMY22_g12605 [Coprinellus aureogranulatus]